MPVQAGGSPKVQLDIHEQQFRRKCKLSRLNKGRAVRTLTNVRVKSRHWREILRFHQLCFATQPPTHPPFFSPLYRPFQKKSVWPVTSPAFVRLLCSLSEVTDAHVVCCEDQAVSFISAMKMSLLRMRAALESSGLRTRLALQRLKQSTTTPY